MKALSQLQQNFQDYLLHNKLQIKTQIVGDETYVEDRLRVYRNAYYLRLKGILAIDYPQLVSLFSAKEFTQLAYSYIDQYPSRTYSLDYFGEHFADFLAQHCPDQPWIAELAQFEWLLALTLIQAEQQAVTQQEIAAVPADAWPEMQFAFHPSVYSITLRWNTLAIWQAMLDEEAALPAAEQHAEPIYCLVYRYQQQACFMLVEPQQWQIVRAIQQGCSFGIICEQLSEQLAADEVATFVAQTLLQWVEQQLLVIPSA